MFQHTAARRRLARATGANQHLQMFQHTAARRRLDKLVISFSLLSVRFNTQPPEGGWHINANQSNTDSSFNTQPPEGGWVWRKC